MVKWPEIEEVQKAGGEGVPAVLAHKRVALVGKVGHAGNGDAAKGKTFVAVISKFDRRFATSGWLDGESSEQILRYGEISRIKEAAITETPRQ